MRSLAPEAPVCRLDEYRFRLLEPWQQSVTDFLGDSSDPLRSPAVDSIS